MAYYGTPAQISKINGDRAYESQLGRMEGLAGEAFELIALQRKHKAAYTSVFNLAWYGLKPLALGLSDIRSTITLEDGIFFNAYEEGKPGYQPERIGPYVSTFNPGYDPTLPLYETWPLFDAVKAAFSDNYTQLNNRWNHVKENTVKIEKVEEKTSIVWLSEKLNGVLKKNFQNMSLKFDPLKVKQNQLILVDGANPPMLTLKLMKNLKVATQNGSTILFWGATNNSKEFIKSLTGKSVEFYKRNATSYIIKGNHAMVNEQNNASYYFSELTKKPISTISIGGDWVEKSQIILEACNTDWLKWNYQGEAIKTAKVYRDEREIKNPANVIVSQSIGKGEIIVSTLELFKLGNQSKHMVRQIIANLGGTFKGSAVNIPQALNSEGILKNANFYGSIKNDSRDIKLVFEFAPLSDKEFTNVNIGTLTKGNYWDILSADANGVFDFKSLNLKYKEHASVYLSFWMYSPRSLTNLLIEPNMPRLDMHFGMDDALAFSINGKVVKEYLRNGGLDKDKFAYEGIPLEKGWNHMLIKVGQDTGDWGCSVRFSCTKPNFLKELKTVVDR